jgi:hypothetical protein
MYVPKRAKNFVPVTTTIPAEMRDEARKQRVPLQQVFLRGWQTLNGEPQILNRQRELEAENVRLNDRVRRLVIQIQELMK